MRTYMAVEKAVKLASDIFEANHIVCDNDSQLV